MDDLISRQFDKMYELGKQAAQPALQPTCNRLATDTISRQAAIDEIDEWIKAFRENGHKESSADARLIQDGIIQLPSAQPEQQWISCSERLPEHGGRYLISVLDGINRRTTVAPYLPRCKAWTMTGRMTYWKVIAWMPLPEPYKAERRTDE